MTQLPGLSYGGRSLAAQHGYPPVRDAIDKLARGEFPEPPKREPYRLTERDRSVLRRCSPESLRAIAKGDRSSPAGDAVARSARRMTLAQRYPNR